MYEVIEHTKEGITVHKVFFGFYSALEYVDRMRGTNDRLEIRLN